MDRHLSLNWHVRTILIVMTMFILPLILLLLPKARVASISFVLAVKSVDRR
jgi:hypothetical protein